MVQMKPVTKEAFGHCSWASPRRLDFAENQQTVPLVLTELGRIIHDIPVGFVEKDGVFHLVGVCSLVPGQNVLIDPEQKRWRGGYVPAIWRAYPFSLLRMTGENRMVFCVDANSGLIYETLDQGNPFFKDQGELAQATMERFEFLQEVEKNKALTARAVSLLHDSELLVPWELEPGDKEKKSLIRGLYKVDETKLNALDEPTFLGLRKAHALPLAYGHLYSTSRLDLLKQLHMRLAQKQAPEPKTENLRDILGFDDNNIFKFDS